MPNTRRKKYSAQYEEKKRKKQGHRCKDKQNIGIPDTQATIGRSFDAILLNNTDSPVILIKSQESLLNSDKSKSVQKPKPDSHKRVNQDVTVTSSDIDLHMKSSNAYLHRNGSYRLVTLSEEESLSSRNYPRTQNCRTDSRESTKTLLLQNVHKAISINGLRPIVQKVSKAVLTGDSIEELYYKEYVAEVTQTPSIEVQLNLIEETPCYSDEVLLKRQDTGGGGNASLQSIGDMCRICHGGEILSKELGALISACSCRGSVGRVHVKCLERWLTESGKNRCELCGVCYVTRRIHRFGVLKSLLMWLFSQNAKQLLVDTLGIMLMSPIAVLAAWLSGRTLAGLMAQESHLLSWPLASTFVLACMTLVCYYCWIVSAATRHALDWWLWYRSQYEVKLQIDQQDDN